MLNIHLPALAAGRQIALAMLALLLAACAAAPAPTPTLQTEFVFGIILVGPYNDHGWSEAHYAGGRYVESKLPATRLIYLDNLNPDARPDKTLEKAVDEMVAAGARIIFVTSDDFAADTYLVAEKYPQTIFIHTTGDHVLKGDAPPNLGNLMGRMEYGKMIAGCAAALTTQTRQIGYLGPLINDETRRLVNAAYLGARYCYQRYRHGQPDELGFRVEWIGFWFYIPGVTADPTAVANGLFDRGADVVLSGIDTTEVMAVAGERAAQGQPVWAIPYNYEGACDVSPQVCLGVPYFNWGPHYFKLVQEAMRGQWKQRWDWIEPDWSNINNRATSIVGFHKGAGLAAEQAAQLDQFIAGLADHSINLFQGPLEFQDGSVYLAQGQAATDTQIWYMPQLLRGMEGLSN